MDEIPIIRALGDWLKEQNPDLLVSSYNYNSWICLDYGRYYSKRIRLGGVTLIYPGGEQALQYDWDAKGEPDWLYRRKVWSLHDPDAFPGILKAAYSIRDKQDYDWDAYKIVGNKMIYPPTRGCAWPKDLKSSSK